MPDDLPDLLGVLGGTFDPVHIGHLRTALDLQCQLPIDDIHLIPNYQPPHRSQPVLDANERMRLLQQAVAELPGLVADDREIRRQGDSYMVDTLTDLKQQFPWRHLCLIIGMDAYNSFCSWHQWETILETAHLIVMQRAGIDQLQNHQLDQHRVSDAEALQKTAAGCVLIQPVSQLEISSTGIRELAAKGENIQFLVPDVIRQQVQTLYKG